MLWLFLSLLLMVPWLVKNQKKRKEMAAKRAEAEKAAEREGGEASRSRKPPP